MLKLKLQYFGHLMQRADSSEMTLILGKIEGKKGVTEDEMVRKHYRVNEREFTQEDSEGQGSLHAAVHRVAKSWTRLCD